MNDLELRNSYPWIHWDEPILVKVPGQGYERLRCRYCIAHRGLKEAEVGQEGFIAEADFRQHLADVHGRRLRQHASARQPEQ